MNKHIFVTTLLCILFLIPVFMTFGKPGIHQNPGYPEIFEFQLLDQEPQPENLAYLHEKINIDQHIVDAGLEGRIVVRVLIDANGQYMTHEVLQAAHPALGEAISSVLPTLKCTAATYEGVPKAAWVTIPFELKLTGNW